MHCFLNVLCCAACVDVYVFDIRLVADLNRTQFATKEYCCVFVCLNGPWNEGLTLRLQLHHFCDNFSSLLR
jgi:hypothetical protein